MIGVVTSPTGAVIRDILHRLADRFPRHVLVWPVRVQGEASAEEVAAAIRGFNALPEDGPMPRPDVLIVARGGGSLEDLWSFNEEIVVRAAAASMIPLISAVGHETDCTLIDFAADRRAPTPTAAAEMAVPVRADLLAQIDGLARRPLACWARGQEARAHRAARRHARAARRGRVAAVPRQRLDRWPSGCRARSCQRADPSQAISALRLAALRRRCCAPACSAGASGSAMRAGGSPPRSARTSRAIASASCATASARWRCSSVGARVNALIERRFASLDRADKLLAALSYQGVLARGFALVRDPAGPPIRSAAAISAGQALDIEFSDGRATALATAAHGIPVKPRQPIRPRRSRGGSGEGQGSLF